MSVGGLALMDRYAMGRTTEMNLTTNEAKKTAIESYTARRADVARLIDVLDMELTKYDERVKAKPDTCWDQAGTMDYVRTTLIDLVEGLSGTERGEIERFLSE